MTAELERLVLLLSAHGWIIQRSPAPLPLPEELKLRYPWLSPEVEEFATHLGEACRGDEKLWLLTSLDFRGQSGYAFAWNEWERLSIESAQDDAEWIANIRAFWDDHLPIALSVDGGYEYYALRSDHTIVCGREPEFEETADFAHSFAEFLEKLVVLGAREE